MAKTRTKHMGYVDNLDVDNSATAPELDHTAFCPAWATLPLSAHKQTQDRLIKMEVDLVGSLVALADEIETGSSAPPKPLPALPHMSLADFNKALPSRLTALQEDLDRQINRIRSLLF